MIARRAYARIRLALGVVVFAMTAAAWVVSDTQSEAVRKANAHLRTSGELLTAMLDQETGLRGYDQTGLDEFLASYRTGRGDLARALVRAHAQAGGDETADALVRAQQDAATTWQLRAQEAVAKVASAGKHASSPDEARARKALMDRFRALNREHRAYVERRVQASLSEFRWYATVGVLGFGVVLLALGFAAVERQSREDVRRRERAQEFIESLQGADDETEAQDLLRRHVERGLPGTSALVLATSNSGTRLTASTSTDALPDVAERLRHAEPRMCLALRRGRAYDRDEQDEPLQSCEICGDRPGATVCEPTVVGGSVIGSLLVTRHSPIRGGARIAVADAVAQAAPVLANLRNLAVAERRAATDALTGLPNHRSMQEAVTRLVANAARTAEPVAAIVLDVDHFKALNDRHGHRVGDEVLAAIAATLRGHLREADFAGRWGGEEFLVMLPGTDAQGGVQTADKLRLALEAIVVPGVPAHVTGSFGVAAFPLHATTGEDLVRAADRAMYDAKHAGRNRVVLAPDPVLELEPASA